MSLSQIRPAAEPIRTSGVSAKLLERFLSRIGEELEDEPLDLPVERHRNQLADLLAQAQAKNRNWHRHAVESYRRALELGACRA